MAAKSKKSKKKSTAAAANAGQSRTIAENRKARHRYEIIEQLECGVVLVGSEVKSLRNGKISLDEAYVRFQNDAIWLIGANIAAYSQASIFNHEYKRPRKLLVRRRQLDTLEEYAMQKGLTLVPLRVYFNSRGLVKLIVGVCRGKKLHDKRETMKKADVKRHIDREMRKRR